MSLGLSPAFVSNPVSHMPPAAAQDLISSMSMSVKRAKELAAASAVSNNIQENQFLTAASLWKLDDDIRTVHASTVMATENVQDNEGWMRWYMKDDDKRIKELNIRLWTLTEVLMPFFSDAQKARYMSGFKRKAASEEDDYNDDE
ncbi:hypothetical protein NEMBOFW57_006838 [Staphylotrichum longicolle]|uniref:Uncharacterized protein n=1 Tax=Staphylotrichum longicolle TaxID=669026 RepID=A0AAD4HUS6_9PEZI|nr:hypothetical protein NEMBOFW57_006838 [Staphylotrichum longicolle]